ncbi:MAG: HEAT repeat domain-containing protein [Pirellulales bacterium]|nr:HEAT repeat domain-containing protein [Pirellulales bacterium]
MNVMLPQRVGILPWILLLGVGTELRADVIELAGGGRLEGKIIQSEKPDRSTFEIELASGGRITISRSQVTHVDTTSAAELEYEQLARVAPDTVEGHWKVVEWCRAHRLSTNSKAHLERILELDPNHAEARASLGFRKNDGQWMNRDDVMAARGLVLYEGRYVTPQHIELMQGQKEDRVTKADWANRIEQLRRWLVGRRQDKAAQAHAEIASINDPEAAVAIVATLRREKAPDLKRLWLDTLGRLDHRAAVDALVDFSLNDPDEDVRHHGVELLIKSGRPGIGTPFVRALQNRDNEIVNRAAIALGQIKDRATLGPLIDALITEHRFKASEGNPDQHAYSFSNDGNAFSFGGGGPKIVTQSVRNRPVLDALLTMSDGANFEFDQAQWRTWLAAQAKATAVDVRRDQ